MKKLIFLVIAGMLFSLLISNLALAQMAEVKVGKGTLKIGGILQTDGVFFLDTDAGTNSFNMKRARFLFWGEIIPDNVKYFVQTDAVGEKFLLDTKFRFFYIPKTEITVGRFLPNFTHHMPRSTAKLDMINYPLVTLKYAMWRQVGIQTTTKTDYVDFNVGIFNGYPKNNWKDNNDAKDLFGRVDFKPNEFIRVGGNAWWGKTPSISIKPDTTTWIYQDTLGEYHEAKSIKADTLIQDTDLYRIGGLFLVNWENLTVNSEYMFGSTDKLYYPNKDSTKEIKSQGFYAHVGYKVNPHVQISARYDFFDPNTNVEKDGESWITGGVNFFLEGYNSMFYLNFIKKDEQGEEIDNDVVKGQVQITF